MEHTNQKRYSENSDTSEAGNREQVRVPVVVIKDQHQENARLGMVGRRDLI